MPHNLFDRVLFRPSGKPRFLSVDCLTTSDTTPDITGTYSARAGNNPTSISVSIDGQGPFEATINPDGTWIVLGSELTELDAGTYEPSATATFPGPVTVNATGCINISSETSAFDYGFDLSFES